MVATHNRPARLAALLESLRAQTLPRDRYEVIVADDGSGEATRRVLDDQLARGGMQLRALRLDTSRGPSVARNMAWRAAEGAFIAITDDDCTASPGWLAGGLAAHRAHPWAVIQGRIEINRDEFADFNVFAHTLEVRQLGPGFETANSFYPRALLEQLGGFDEQEFRGPGGEDTDLGLRALKAGADAIYAPGAVIYHGVLRSGAAKRLRIAGRWAESVKVFKLHPELRRGELHPQMKPGPVLRWFWRYNHWLLLRFAVALALPRRFGTLRLVLAAPYVRHLSNRRTGPAIAPYLIAHDAVEMSSIVRGAIRYRVFIA